MDLAIVVVSWNTRDLLRDCLASLPAATAELDVRVLVVDNASADGSAAMVRAEFPGCELIEAGANLGFSRANNLALARLDAGDVLLLNPDTVCPPGSLKRLHDFLRATPDAGAAGPTLVDAEGRPAQSWGRRPALRWHLMGMLGPLGTPLRRALRGGQTAIPRPEDPSRPVAYAVGACLMLRREALDAVGPLDERFFMYFEETDWCLRAAAAGWKVYHAAGIEVAHLEGRAARKAAAFTLEQFQHSKRLFLQKQDGPGRVAAFRAVMFVEYALKWGLRSLLAALDRRGRDRHRALAHNFGAMARLQCRGRLDPAPPA